MIEDTTRRALDLVEELRAEIDFEIDDVIADILRDLPDEYFQRLRRSDQLKHLKTLLAISICQLDNQISLRSKDDRHIAVIGRQDYPGLLAKIVKRLPSEQPLIAAQIFTSKAHTFIIDLFEFEVPNPDGINDSAMVDRHEIESAVDQVATELGVDRERIAEFVDQYPRTSQVLTSATMIRVHFQAYVKFQERNESYINWYVSEGTARLTVATDKMPAREVFRRSAEFLAEKSLDIDSAFLNDLVGSHSGQNDRAAIASFAVSNSNGPLTELTIEPDGLASYLAEKS